LEYCKIENEVFMGDRNGYFSIKSSAEGTVLRLFPAQNNGEPIKIDEILDYFSRHKIKRYEISRIQNALEHLEEETEVFLSIDRYASMNEEICVTVSADEMKAVARFYPSSNQPTYLDKDDILRILNNQGIREIQEEALNAFIRDREYCKDYIIAEGTPMIPGKDAKITYYFNLTPNTRPKLNEDGSVNFHELDNINRVKCGDVLVTLEKEEYGVPGRNVYGTILAPGKVKTLRLKYGKGVLLSEDGLSLVSQMDGHVMLTVDDKVVVSNTYIIEGNVDVSTGDIRYDGNVRVKGHVCTGFTIIAAGDVEIEDVVEGAKIIAQGQIILKRGIQGMGKGILQAQGAIVTKFIESASVLTNSSITAESILYSQVSAKGEIHVSGKKGMIVGGHVRSTTLIDTQIAGSAMGGNTILEVGMDPVMQDRMKKLEAELRQIEINQEKNLKIIEVYKGKQQKGKLPSDKIIEFQQLLTEYSELDKRLKQISPELDHIYESLNGVRNSQVKVQREIHPGVKLVIAGEMFYVMKEDRRCRYYLGDDRLVKRGSC